MSDQAKVQNKVLGFFPLLAMVVGSVVGAGIFTSPAQLGRGANSGFIFIGWLITGLGIFSLTRVFQYLNGKRPELEGGIYSYAREAAGEFVGFNSAYGYWWSVLFGNLSYFFAIPGILALYIPVIGQNNWVALAVSSALLWGYFSLIMSGIKTAGITNVVITLLKLLPLLFVAIVAILLFKRDIFGEPFALALASDPTITASPKD
ncbi:MAG TPA: amino acid permease, partial [Spirochaetales bacterium]|nr:amino acid permease [Spirochaetales bacterium]